MIYSTKLTKRKKSNSFAFTLIEVLIVIIIIGIIVATLSFDFKIDKSQIAIDNLAKDLRYTRSLALKDDKYQPFPIDNSTVEQNRSKYWFKQFWQLKFATDGSDLIYMIFSDQPANGSTNNFDKKVIKSSHVYELAKYADGRYVYGGNTYLYAGESANQDANLSRMGVKKIIFHPKFLPSIVIVNGLFLCIILSLILQPSLDNNISYIFELQLELLEL